MWPWTKSGEYLVSSGYHWIHQRLCSPRNTTTESSHITDPSIWKSLWKINTLPKAKHFLWRVITNAAPTMLNLFKRRILSNPICPICGTADESFEHILLLCPWVELIWFGSPLGLRIDKQLITTFDNWLISCTKNATIRGRAYLLTVISLICWNIWKARCLFVYQHLAPSPDWVLSSTQKLFRELMDAVGGPSTAIAAACQWSPPSIGLLKINVDASWRPPDRVGIGTIVRDSDRNPLAGSSFMECASTISEAEALAILAGAEIAFSLHARDIIIESDSKEVIDELIYSHNKINWKATLLVQKIRSYCSKFHSCIWQWSPREANRVAHYAASLADGLVGSLRWASQPPPSMVLVLRNDGLPCPHGRAE